MAWKAAYTKHKTLQDSIIHNQTTLWAKKLNAPFYFWNNFVQLQCVLIFSGTQILK